MMIFGGAFSFVLVAFIAYLALSKTTSRMVRAAALAALALIGLTIVVCSFILFLLLSRETAAAGITSEYIPVVPVEKARNDIFPVLVFSAVLLVIIIIIIIAAFRDQKRAQKKFR